MTLRTPEAREEAHAWCLKMAKPYPMLEAALAASGAASVRWNRARASLRETLARAIVGQQVSTYAANAIWGRLQALASDADLFATLAQATPEALRGCGLSGMKVKFLTRLAQADAEGVLNPRQARAEDGAAFRARLLALPGIGPWTCDMAAIFWRHDTDVWPDGDLAVRKTFARLTQTEESTTQRAAAPFAPWRTMLALHMWEAIRRERAARASASQASQA